MIISIDTLKSARYRHHLQNHRWDVVVIDECHNVVNPGTQNFRLAELLASRTDALLLASATPHNGKPDSFARLINLLDPTAIADPADYDADDIRHLYVRRHRGSSDVTHEVIDKQLSVSAYQARQTGWALLAAASELAAETGEHPAGQPARIAEMQPHVLARHGVVPCGFSDRGAP